MGAWLQRLLPFCSFSTFDTLAGLRPSLAWDQGLPRSLREFCAWAGLGRVYEMTGGVRWTSPLSPVCRQADESVCGMR